MSQSGADLGDNSRSFSFQELPEFWNASVSDACAFGNCLAVAAHADSRFQIHVFGVNLETLTLAQVRVMDVDGEVTCLSLGADDTVWAGVRKGSLTFLARASLQKPFDGLEMLNLADCES